MSERKYDWAEVVKLNPKGHMEWQKPLGVMVYNGPVESVIVDDDDLVRIKLAWVAQMPYPGHPGYGKWRVAEDVLLEQAFPNFLAPFEIQKTEERGPRVFFGGAALIYIEPGNNVDPADVEGLVSSVE